MNRLLAAALLAAAITSPAHAKPASRGRWICIFTVTLVPAPRVPWSIYYGTFPNAAKADEFCRKLIAAPGPVGTCKPWQLILPSEFRKGR